jgi:hypothetical protein
MKIVSTVLKIVAALAALAGIVYVIATYGDKIVAWAKKMLGKCPCCCEDDCDDCQCESDCDDCPCDCCCDEGCECACDCCDEAAEEAAEEATPAEEAAVKAEEADFEG